MNTQAVFSLRGKPLNSFGLTKKVVYENEEFNLLQAALDIEDGCLLSECSCAKSPDEIVDIIGIHEADFTRT